LRDLKVLARPGIEPALSLLANLHRVEGGTVVIAIPPVIGPDLHVLQSPTGIRSRPERKRQCEDTHRGGRIAAFGLPPRPRRSDVRGYAGLDRLPACVATLINIHLRVRTANSDNGN